MKTVMALLLGTLLTAQLPVYADDCDDEVILSDTPDSMDRVLVVESHADIRRTVAYADQDDERSDSYYHPVGSRYHDERPVYQGDSRWASPPRWDNRPYWHRPPHWYRPPYWHRPPQGDRYHHYRETGRYWARPRSWDDD